MACVNSSKTKEEKEAGHNESSDTKLLVVTADASLYVWDLEKDNERCVFGKLPREHLLQSNGWSANFSRFVE